MPAVIFTGGDFYCKDCATNWMSSRADGLLEPIINSEKEVIGLKCEECGYRVWFKLEEE